MTIRPAPNAPSNELDIGRLASSLARRWLLILCVTIAGSVAGYAVQHVLTPTYMSTVSILLDPKRPGGPAGDGQFSTALVDATKIGSVVSIIQSANLLSRVVKSEHLADNEAFGGPMMSMQDRVLAFVASRLPFSVIDPPPPEPNTEEAREARALVRLSKAVTTTRVQFTYVINVQVTANAPDDAQRIATAVADAYLNDQTQARQEALQRDSVWFAQQLAEMRRELIKSEEAVEALRRQYGIAETSQGPNVTTDRQVTTELTAQWVAAANEVAAHRAKYEQTQRVIREHGDLGSLPDVAASLTIRQLRVTQSDLARKIVDLAARYTATYPELVAARRDKGALDAQISAEIGRIVDGIRNDYETAVTRQAGLSKMLEHHFDTSQDQLTTEGKVKLREAQRVADANQAIYDAELRRSRQEALLATRQDMEARILSAADHPTAPKFPRRGIFVGLGAVAGMMAGVGLAFLRVSRETRFATAKWIEETLALPVLGSMPTVTRRELSKTGAPVPIPEYIRAKPLSRFGEAVRSLRVRLAAEITPSPRVIQVTSAVPGEGKSTIAATLAMSAALAGNRTILVDLDIRNSSVSNLFEMTSAVGVVDVLQQELVVGTALQTFDKLPLSVIAAGQNARNPDLISSTSFRAMVNQLANEFDVVILDSPPILAVSDSILISSAADVTLLVVRWQATPKELVKQAAKILRSSGSKLAGVAFNGVDAGKVTGYGEEFYNTYHYGYGKYVS